MASIPNDPFNSRGRPSLRAGLDLKDRLTSNLTLDATFNPDFGQVEVDPAVLNLSAFETFFPEKKTVFHRRRAGIQLRRLQLQLLQQRRRHERVLLTTHRSSAKRSVAGVRSERVRGRSRRDDDPCRRKDHGPHRQRLHGWVCSNALTGEANARVETLTGERAKQEVEPLADYFVGRLKRDYMNGNLVVGGVVSGVTRKIDDVFAPRLARHAEMYGNDVFYTWGDRMYSFQANAAVTNVTGDARAIAARQLSSARYFQRPDRGEGSGGFFSNRFDPDATSLRGGGAYARIAKNTGDWFGEVQTNIRTPGYETNDYAFQQRADYIWTGANIGRIWTKPTSWYRQIYAIAGLQNQNNFEGDNTQRQFHAYYSSTTPQFWNVSTFYILRPAVIDDRALRGGPAVRSPTNHFMELDISSDSRSQLIGNGGVGVYGDDKSRPEHQCVRQCDVSSGVECERDVWTVVFDRPDVRAVRPGRERYDRLVVLRNALCRLVAGPAHARSRHAAQRDVLAEHDARALCAALPRRRQVLRLQGVRGAAVARDACVWSRPRDDRGDDEQ